MKVHIFSYFPLSLHLYMSLSFVMLLDIRLCQVTPKLRRFVVREINELSKRRSFGVRRINEG